jgi:MoaA/NifB/PqqE/SkfB family radical SAM enzyme
MTLDNTPKKETFCILPWVHTATLTDGSVQLCCVAGNKSSINLNDSTLEDYWNSNFVKQTRLKMLNGQEVDACRRCYQEESNGYRSHRQVENDIWNKKLGSESYQNLIKSTAPDGNVENGPMSIDLRLGNTCNLQCIMCQPRDSSRWLANARRLSSTLQDRDLVNEWTYKSQISVEKFEWYKNAAFWDGLDSFLPYLREIIIAGGEPMLIAEQSEFIQRCVKSGEAKHIQLRYHTNGTVLPEELIPYWKEFETVEMFVSLDGMTDVANYVRYPTNWAEVEPIIDRYDDMPNNIKLKILYTAHALNTFYIPEFLDWISSKNYKKYNNNIQSFVHPSMVHYPQYLNLKVLPSELKKIITERITDMMHKFPNQPMDKYIGIVNFMNDGDWSEKMPMLVEYINELDRLRQTSFKKTFSELVPYFDGVK